MSCINLMHIFAGSSITVEILKMRICCTIMAKVVFAVVPYIIQQCLGLLSAHHCTGDCFFLVSLKQL